MSDLVISPISSPHIERYRLALPQALLLSGVSGVGLYTIASHIAEPHGDILTIHPELLTKTSTIPQISIEKVRDLYDQTRTRSARGRVIIIDNADTMTIPAQNAFLKLLEEPNESTRFILTSHRPESLLPTIRSRLENQYISQISRDQTNALLDKLPNLTAKKRTQLLFIAEGLPAELYRLTNDEMMFREKASLIGTAKNLIEGNSLAKIVTISKEKLTRQAADTLADQLIILLSRSPSPSSVKYIDRLLTARERIASGGNVKLQLLAAMV